MLLALKPGDSVYNAKKYFIKKSLIKTKKKSSFAKKISLPFIKNNKITFSSLDIRDEPLTQRENDTNIRFNSFSSLNSTELNNNFILTNFSPSNISKNKLKLTMNSYYNMSNDFNTNKMNTNLNNIRKKIIEDNYECYNYNSFMNQNINKKPMLSETFLPKLNETSKVNSYSLDKNKDISNKSIMTNNNNKCNYLYLKYEGEEFDNELKNKIYIQINPNKLINSLEKMITYNIKIINGLDEDINNKKQNKSRRLTNSNDVSTNIINNPTTNQNSTDYNSINVNDYLHSDINTENNFLSSSGNEDNRNNKYKTYYNLNIKNIFLSDIIQKVYNHMVEIRDKNNKIILQEDIRTEFNNQITKLRNFFNTQLNNRNKENNIVANNNKNDVYKKISPNIYKKINIKKIKPFNNFDYNKFEEIENKINHIKNTKVSNNNTEINNKELLELFKEKLNVDKHIPIKNIYNNILNLPTNNNRLDGEILGYETYREKNIKNYKDKLINTDRQWAKSKENILRNNNLNKLTDFFEKYKNAKQSVNIINQNSNEYIFEKGPKLHIVDFKEIIDEIENQSKNTNDNNFENYFNFILSDESLYNKIKFNSTIMQKCFEYFSINYKNKKNSDKLKLNKNLKKIIKQFDILKDIGDKLHKKIIIKIRRKKHNLSIDTNTDLESNDNKNKTIYYEKHRKREFKLDKEENNYNLTDSKMIETETNSSEFSDVPSYVSYTKVKKLKDKQSQKIKELKKKNIINKEEIEKILFNPNLIKDDKENNNQINNKEIIKENEYIEKKEENEFIGKKEENKYIEKKEENEHIEKKEENKHIGKKEENKHIGKKHEEKIEEKKNEEKKYEETKHDEIKEEKKDEELKKKIIKKQFNVKKRNKSGINGTKRTNSLTGTSTNKENNKSQKMNMNNNTKNEEHKSNKKLDNSQNSQLKIKKRTNIIKEKLEKESKKSTNQFIYKKEVKTPDKKIQKRENFIENKIFPNNKNKKKFKKEDVPKINQDLRKVKNKLKRKMSKNEFSELMHLINKQLNIPSRNYKIINNSLRNSLPLFTSQRKTYILNSLGINEDEPEKNYNKKDSFLDQNNSTYSNNDNNNNIDKTQTTKSIRNKIKEKNEKFKKIKNKIIENKYKTISYFDLKDDSRLILLRPILKYTLYLNHDKNNLYNIVKRLFGVTNKYQLSLNLNNSDNSIESNSLNDNSLLDKIDNDVSNSNFEKIKSKIKHYDSLVKHKVYNNLSEKYYIPLITVKTRYYKDDNDLLNSKNNKIFKRIKRVDRKIGFKEFMIEELNKINEENLLDDFENMKKENDKIRKQIQEIKEEKNRKMEEWNKKFDLFKSHIQKLKKMDDKELKNDSLRFIYKIENNYEVKRIFDVKQAKRINDFKKFINTHKEKRNIIDNLFKGQIVFKPNCVFTSQNVFH